MAPLCSRRTCSFCSISLRTFAFSFSAFSLVFPRVSTRTWTRPELISLVRELMPAEMVSMMVYTMFTLLLST